MKEKKTFAKTFKCVKRALQLNKNLARHSSTLVSYFLIFLIFIYRFFSLCLLFTAVAKLLSCVWINGKLQSTKYNTPFFINPIHSSNETSIDPLIHSCSKYIDVYILHTNMSMTRRYVCWNHTDYNYLRYSSNIFKC